MVFNNNPNTVYYPGAMGLIVGYFKFYQAALQLFIGYQN
jgi:hypothetical protein